MAKTRLEIQDLLESIDPSLHVYYQPPPSVHIKYPAIIYKLDDIDQLHADDRTYLKSKSYMITLVHSDPDNNIIDKLIDMIPNIRFDRTYISDNLYHYIYILYE